MNDAGKPGQYSCPEPAKSNDEGDSASKLECQVADEECISRYVVEQYFRAGMCGKVTVDPHDSSLSSRYSGKV